MANMMKWKVHLTAQLETASRSGLGAIEETEKTTAERIINPATLDQVKTLTVGFIEEMVERGADEIYLDLQWADKAPVDEEDE